jgi:hypothetical protein
VTCEPVMTNVTKGALGGSFHLAESRHAARGSSGHDVKSLETLSDV